jgi:hypothetical protein
LVLLLLLQLTPKLAQQLLLLVLRERHTALLLSIPCGRLQLRLLLGVGVTAH